MANLININNTKIRKTYSYAKYLMCVKLGRILSRDEQVDHIDGNKLNDDLLNLQILSVVDNMRKMVIETGKSAKLYKFVCPICGKEFTRDARNSQWKLKKGMNIHCSRSCGGKSPKRKESE